MTESQTWKAIAESAQVAQAALIKEMLSVQAQQQSALSEMVSVQLEAVELLENIGEGELAHRLDVALDTVYRLVAGR